MKQHVVRRSLRVDPPKPGQQSQNASVPELQPSLPPKPTPRPYRAGNGVVPWLIGLGIVVGGTLLAGKNSYDRNLGRYRDVRGRFRQGRFF